MKQKALPCVLAIAFTMSLSYLSFSQNANNTTLRLPEKSKLFSGIEWIGPAIPYGDSSVRGDTYPVTWAANDTIYASAGDPLWGAKPDGLDFESIVGNAPNYTIRKVNDMMAYRGWGGCGLKPTGLISVGGTLYLAFQNMTGVYLKCEFGGANYVHGYDAGIVYSTDNGKSWKPDITKHKTPMFPGRIFASPAFINYGKDNVNAVDNFVYAISGEGWCNGNNCRLGRVSKNKIMQASAWQFVSGFDSMSKPIWSKNLFDATPILTHNDYLGYVDMVYIAKLKRYLLFSWHFNKHADPDSGSKIIIYESPQPWGPFSVVYTDDWENKETTPYNPRMPLKWFDPEKLEGWILFSGTWRTDATGKIGFNYRAHVRKFKLLLAK